MMKMEENIRYERAAKNVRESAVDCNPGFRRRTTCSVQYSKLTMTSAPIFGSHFPPHGLLLVGHGTRNELGLAEFHRLVRQVAEMGAGYTVESCFLELAQPDIAAGVRRILERGVTRLMVAPVLLFAAGHAKRDIPAAVRAAIGNDDKAAAGGRTAARDGLIIEQLGALECHQRIIELSTQRFREALADRPPIDPANTLLIMVARGSSVPEAIDKMHRFTELRRQRTPVGQCQTCFVAAASPGFRETLAWAAQTNHRRIVVQPHLLFTGEVLTEIDGAVREIAQRQPHREWIVTPHLGPSPLVAEAILDLARNT